MTNTRAGIDLEKVRERHHKIPYGATAFICEECHVGDCSEEPYGFWPCDAIKLAAELQDIRDSEQTILAEKCANDEKHCGCVPTLRGEIERLTFDRKELGQLGREAKRLREALELIKVRADQVTELDPEWLIEEIGKIARAELEKKT